MHVNEKYNTACTNLGSSFGLLYSYAVSLIIIIFFLLIKVTAFESVSDIIY